MIYLILRLLIAALLALPGVVTEETTSGLEGGVTEECTVVKDEKICDETTDDTPPPSELPGPS